MCIDFSRKDRLMSQHFLNCTQICTTIDKVCCKRMTESMRTNFFLQTNFFSQAFYNSKNHDPAKFLPTSVQKKNVFTFLTYLQCFAVITQI